MSMNLSIIIFFCLSLFILNCSNKTRHEKAQQIVSSLDKTRPTLKKIFDCSGIKVLLEIDFQKDEIEAPYFGKVSILIEDKEIFRDKEIFEYLDSFKLITYKDNTFIFCQYRDRPDPNSWHVIQLKQFKFKMDTLIPTGIGVNFSDIDNDGLIEFGGLLPFYESYCSSCDSNFYISNRIYEISNSIQLDTALSKAENIKEYGYHIDFSIGKHIIPSKR